MVNKHFLHLLIIELCFLLNTCVSISNHRVRAITANDYGNPNIEIPPDKIRWEIGLREATYQALRRERISQPHLKDEIYSAPILGHQDAATPFGDIAILARGQLYSTPIGYKFIQDAYRNDCDDCHNKPFRCTDESCKPYRDKNSKSLIALWTVKRIRHRDLNGHRFELQFTVSPMSPAAPRDFVTRNGHFDYSIPGHVFIIKVKNPGERSRLNYNRSEKYKGDSKPSWSNHHGDTFNAPSHLNLNEFTPNAANLQTGEFYSPSRKPDSDPNHIGYLIGISNNYKPDVQITEHSHETPFITTKDHFHTKTHEHVQVASIKEPERHYHHHFYIPDTADIENNQKDEKYPANTPLEHGQKFILTTGTVNAQQIPLITTNHAYAFKTTYKYPDTTIPIPVQPIIFSPSTQLHPTPSPNQNTIFKIISIPTATQATPFRPSPVFIQYSEPDTTYSNNEPPTVAGYITTSFNPTTEPYKSTLISHPEISTIDLNNQQTDIPTTTQKERSKYPDSINAQLPPPKNNIDTTIPYVSTTTVISITPKPLKTKYTDYESVTLNTSPEVTTEEQTEYLTSTVTNPTTVFKTTHNKIERYQTELSTTTTDSPTTITTTKLSTTSKKRYGRPYNYRPSYVDDLDIFADNKTEKDIKSSIFSTPSTTTVMIDEIFPEQVTIPSSTTEIIKNQRISKYLKYKQRNRNGNRYNKYRNYNSERLRQRQNSTRLNDLTSLQQLTRPTDILKTDAVPNDDNVETKTSQSLITSISFKVNRSGKRFNDFARPAILPANGDKTLRPYYHHTTTTKEYNVFKEPLPETTTEMQYTKAFDDLAQTLVNHARIASYLESKTTNPPITTTNSHK